MIPNLKNNVPNKKRNRGGQMGFFGSSIDQSDSDIAFPKQILGRSQPLG